MANVKLVLREDVDHLGRRGDVVTVRPGYARNRLLPQHLALRHTEENVRRVGREKQLWLQAEAARIEEFREVKDRLDAAVVEIVAKAGESGHLYGSVSEKQVHDALGALGFVLDPRAVRLETPIKELGETSASVALHPEVTATVKVRVVPEGGATTPAAG